MKKLRLFDSLKFMLATVACVFILNVAHAATLPAGYTELEYLESTAMPSRAYINTGLNFNSNYIYEINFLQSNVHNWIMGAAIEAYNKKGAFILTYCNDITCFYSSTTSAAMHSSGLSLPNNVRHTAKYQQSTKTALLDDRNVWWNSWITDENIPYNIFLFGYNIAGNVGGGRSGYLRIYSYRVKDADGVLIQNFIPARRDSDRMLGMYDLADSNPETAFHTNAGTGTFIAGEYSIKIATTRYNEQQFAPVQNELSNAMNVVDDVVTRTMSQAQAIDTIATTKQTRPDEGCDAKYCLLVEGEDGTPHWYPIAGANGVAHNLPVGYTELQYIESTGTQYIDTGIVTQNGIGFDVTFLTNNSVVPGNMSYGAILGGRVSSGDNDFQITTFTPVGSTMGTIRNGPSTPVISAKISTNTKLHISLINDVITYNDGTTASVSSYEYTAGKNIYLFGINSNDSFTQSGDGCRIYNAKLLVGSNVVFDGIPAKQGTTVGMYDLVSGQFFTNAGTDDFTAGPDM